MNNYKTIREDQTEALARVYDRVEVDRAAGEVICWKRTPTGALRIEKVYTLEGSMKVQIEKHANTLATRRSNVAQERWILAAYGREFRDDDYSYYHIEIDNGHPEDQITRVVAQQGQYWEIISAEEKDARLEAITEHEEIDIEEAVLPDDVMTEGQLAVFGGRPDVFEPLKRKWRALNEFVAFGITL